MIVILKLANEIGTPIVNATIYRCIMGKLIYFTNTHPNLMFAVRVAQVITWPLPKRLI
jgi:hypothetical protein